MLNLLTIDLSKFGRSISGIIVVTDEQDNILVPMTRENATRLFGDAELLRNAVKDSATDAKMQVIFDSVHGMKTLEEVEEHLLAASAPVSVRFLKEQ